MTGERFWNRSAKRGEKIMGDLKAIKEQWLSFQSRCNVDELMAVSYILVSNPYICYHGDYYNIERK